MVDVFRLLVATPTIQDRSGKLILVMDLLRVLSKELLLPRILELIFKYSCVKIPHSMVSLVMLGLEHFAKLHTRAIMLESMKNDKMFC